MGYVMKKCIECAIYKKLSYSQSHPKFKYCYKDHGYVSGESKINCISFKKYKLKKQE